MKDTGEQTRRLQRQNGNNGNNVLVGTPPLNIRRPELTGDAIVGALLTCDPGEWIGSLPMTFAYQWAQDNIPISGASTSTYTVQVEDLHTVLHCTVTASNLAGTESENSSNVYVIGARYQYTPATVQYPLSGNIACATTGQIMRVHAVDLDGLFHGAAYERLQTGDSITLGTASAQLGSPASSGPSNGVYDLFLTSPWPVLSAGEYILTISYR